MKSVLLSIQPKWVEKIAGGNKTIEVRKRRPKIETPFKCYIYCTKARNKNDDIWGDAPLKTVWHDGVPCVEYADGMPYLNGSVIGEFVCNKIYDITTPKDYFSEYLFFAHHGKSPEGSQDLDAKKLLKETCLSMDDMIDYASGKTLFGWHIADLKIYDKPKELDEFWAYNEELHKRFERGEKYCCYDGTNEDGEPMDECALFNESVERCYRCWEEWSGWCHRVIRPPQSWCYVETKVLRKGDSEK